MVDDWATPQIRLPTSKIKNNAKKLHYNTLDLAPTIRFALNYPRVEIHVQFTRKWLQSRTVAFYGQQSMNIGSSAEPTWKDCMR